MTNSLNILEWAAQEGYAAVIQGLQARPKEHDFPCHAKNDALRLAAANGHLRHVDPLLSMGAELSPLPFIFPFAHYTPLQLAAKNGQLAMLELLLVRGAAPGTLSREYLTPFEYALNNNRTRVELETCLSIAANMGRLSTVQVLLEKGVGKNGTRVIDGRILRHAVSKGNVECTRVLYKHGAWFKPEAFLQSAIIHGHEAMVQFLLERGASCPGRTAYCRALEFSRWSIFKLLLGSRVGAQSTKRDTALHLAAHIGDERVVQLLLANRADASAPDEDGLRPLHYVVGAVSLHLNVYDDWVKTLT